MADVLSLQREGLKKELEVITQSGPSTKPKVEAYRCVYLCRTSRACWQNGDKNPRIDLTAL